MKNELKTIGILGIGGALVLGFQEASNKIEEYNRENKKKVDYILQNTPQKGFNKDYNMYRVTGEGNETIGKIISKMAIKNISKENQKKFMNNFYKTIEEKNRKLKENGSSERIDFIKKGDLIELKLTSDGEAFININQKTIIFIDMRSDFIYI